MEKTVVISGKEVTFKSVGTLPKLYKMQFQRDFFEDLHELSTIPLHEIILNMLKGQTVKPDVFLNVAWVLAKTADKSIPDLARWVKSFESFSIVELIPDIQEILSLSIGTKKSNNDRPNQGTSGGSINTETYLVLCHECKLSHDDLETMTIGMVLDYIDEYIDTHSPEGKKKNEKVIEYADEVPWL